MNLYVILLPLVIQGLALGCCEEYDADDVSGEGSWDQDDWNKSGDTSTGEDDNFTGFKSGSSSTDKAEDDEQPKFYPRISQTHSNRIFVTSGVGEDKGGSKHDGRSHYSSENSGNQENNEDFGSSMDLSKVGDAIDVMKRLKKAKSDQEFAKKLRSGPESLGVAFKTFEQLSGLWISVMHRIWRVWKAKGAKVVMHSIVNDMVHNTGRAITQKLGKMLNNTIDVNMNSSGSAAFDKDDGSTEPEKKHRIDTVHHQTDLPVQRVSIDFIKNVSSIGRKSSHTKPIKEPEEKVKVSFLKRNMNESKPKLKSETHNLMKNTMSIIQKTSEEKENKNFTSIRDKSETRSTLVPKITLPVSLTNGEEKRSSTNNTLVIINKENHKNVDADTEKSKSDPRKGEIQKEKQHIKIIDVKERENNSSKKSSGDSLRREDESRPEIKLRGEDNSARGGGGKRPVELVKPAVKQLSAINKATNDDQRDQNNTKSFFPKRKVSQNKVNTSRSEMERVKKSGKSTALETMRINFLKRNRTSLSDPKTTLSYVIGSETRGNNVLPALLNTSNTPLHNKSISRNDSSTLHKSTSAVESNYRETYPTGKRILNVEKSQTNKEPYAQRDKNSSRKGLTGNNTTTTSDVLPKRTKKPPSAKSENIVIKLNGKKGASKVNKANDTVHENFKAMDTHEVKEGIDINYMQRNVTAKMKTDAIKETSPAQFSDNSVLTHQKRLTSSRKNVKESKITSEAALNTLQANKTVTKENTLTKRKNVSNSERGFSNSQNGGITYNKEATRGDVQKARYKNPMRIVVQIENRTQTKKNEKGKLVDDISFPLKKEPQKGAAISVARGESQQKIIVTSQKLGSSKGAIRKVTEEKAKQDPLDSKNETRKDQTNSKSKTLEEKEKIEIKLNLKRGVPSGKASISHAPNSMLGRKDKKGSENYINDTQHLQGNSMPVKDENRHRSFSNKILANHPEKSDKLEGRDNATNGPVKTRVTQGPGNGVTHASGSGVTHASGSGVTHDSGGGSKDYRGRSVTRDSTVDTRHDPGSGSIRDPNLTSSDLLTKATKRHHSKHVSDNEIVKHKVSHSPQQVIDAQYKQLSKLKPMSKQPNKPNSESVPPPKDAKYEHFSKVKMSPKSHQDFQASRKTKEERPPSTSRSEDHQAAIKEISGIDENSPSMKIQSNLSEGDQSPKKEDEKSTKPNPGIDDKLTSSKLKNSSSGREQTPAEEDKQSSKSHQVEVLTSRTPPTSLLTTSNDDNTYSIKQIVQGPRGSSFVYGIHNDDKVYNLEKKVSRLESEVTVLETAMADLAKRLLVVEQKSEVPQPTMPTIIHSSIKSEPEEKHPAHNQQTNVYISKDEAPKLPNPEKIVIPISSLFPERSGHVSKPSHFIHEEQETKVDTHLENEDQVKPQDSARLSLRGGAQSSPSSEAHAVVRPIVNIIVPNNRADLFPDGVSPACIPRCQNGGRCLEGNSCRCPTFFTGDHCERFSLKDLLESPDLRERPYRKLQRIVVSEPPDRQILDGTLNLDSGPPAAVEYRDISQYRDLNQDTLPAKEFVAKQQRTESTLPTNDAEIDGGSRRRQLILEI